VNWFPLLLATHIVLAVGLLAPSLLLPFLLRRRIDAARPPGPVPRLLLALNGGGSLAIAIGLAVTGAGLIALLGVQLLTQPWLLVALGLYAVNLVVAAVIARPSLRRLLRLDERTDDDTWRRWARRQRWVAYLMAGVTGLIGFLMSTKPTLW